MPIISRFFGIIIRMFFNEHAPPHFHAEYGEYRATVDIRSLTVIDGKLPRRATELVLDWAELHQGECSAIGRSARITNNRTKFNLSNKYNEDGVGCCRSPC